MTPANTSSAQSSSLWIAVRPQEPAYPENENEWQITEDDTGVIIAILAGPLDAEVAGNARVMAAAPDLLHLAKVFKMTCEDRLSLLRNDEKDWRPDDERQDTIGHYTSLRGDCERAIANAEAK